MGFYLECLTVRIAAFYFEKLGFQEMFKAIYSNFKLTIGWNIF